MRVCMVNPSGSAFGYVHQQCQALARQGWDVDLFTSPYWVRASRPFALQYRVHPCFYRHTQARSAVPGFRGAVWRVLRACGHVFSMTRVLILARQYDVVHIQWLPVPAFDSVVLSMLARVRPVVYTVHDLYPHDRRKSRCLVSLLRHIYALPHALVVHSEWTARGLVEDFGVDPRSLQMIKLGNMDYLLELDGGESHATASASPTVLFFGNIRADKGLDILLRAMALVLQEVPAARLMVVGIPRVDMGPYNRLVDQLGIGPAVEFQLRHVKEGELPGIFRSADVVALPYREIDQSGVAVTACTFGRALVATTVGGIKELVEEAGNGILVAPEDPYGLAKALIAVLTDSSLRVGFETRARDYALTALSWDPIAAQLSREYRRLVAGKA